MKRNKEEQRIDKLVKQYGGFFAFNNEQLKEGYDRIKEKGHVKQGEKVQQLEHGLFIPSKHVTEFLNKL